jgi:calcineurin-like phosphoesterase
MAGAFHSVIGVGKEDVIKRFLTSIPDKFEAASQDARLNAVFVDVDSTTGRARSIKRIHRD